MKNIISDLLYIFKRSNIKLGARFLKLQTLVLAASFFELIGLAVLVPFVDFVINKSGFFNDVFIKFDLPNFGIGHISLVVLLLYSTGTLLSLYAMNKLFHFAHTSAAQISIFLYSHILRESLSGFQVKDKSVITKNLTQEVDRVTEAILIPLVQINAKLVIAITLVAYLFYTDLSLTLLLCTLFFIVYGGVILYSKNKLRKFSKVISHSNSGRFVLLNSMLLGFKEIKVYEIEKFFIEKFKKETTNYSFSRASAQYLSGSAKFYIEFIVIVFFVFVSMSDLLSQADSLIILALSMLKLLPALQLIYGSYSTIKSNEQAVVILKEVVDSESSCTTVLTNKKVVQPVSDVQVSAVDLTFMAESKIIIDNINLEIIKGEKISIIGKSGSGKSTLISLLLGLYDDYQGELHVNASIGYVPQDIFLYNANIVENIVLDLDMDEDWFATVMDICELNEFTGSASSNVHGVESLSGGQKQRIGIARAIYRNPSLLILDEATSGLDIETEAKIMNNILSLDLTVISIAHRQGAIKGTDKIFLLDRGKIVSSGTFDNYFNESNERYL